MTVVRKARKAGALFGGRKPGYLVLKTLRFTLLSFVKEREVEGREGNLILEMKVG